MQFDHLDTVKPLMQNELQIDVECGATYLSPRLTAFGALQWRELLDLAIREHDERWLAARLRQSRLLKEVETYSRLGVAKQRRVPATAADTLAEGEFNRYYIRGVCRFAIENGGHVVAVCRVRDSDVPREESQRLIGRELNATEVLNDLRNSPGVDVALGVPPGPNSGLSVRLPAGFVKAA